MLPAAATTVTPVQTVVRNETYEDTSFNWGVNAWSENGSAPSYIVEKNSVATNAYQGSGSARFKVITPAAVFPLTNFQFVKGQRYKVEAKIKADQAATVELMIRGGGPGYFPYAFRRLSATTQWQDITIEGIPNETSTLFLTTSTGPNIYLDNLKISTIQQDELVPVNKTSSIPDTMFGLHVNRLGAHNSWPQTGQKIIRLHDTGTHWCNLETAPGVWDFSRLDYYVQYATNNNLLPNLIYNMGQTPVHASGNPGVGGFYCTGYGSSAPPADMEAWRTYVTKVGQRYQGKIRYWEIWNEWDIPGNYSGDVANMVEMTRIAKEVLKGIDPTNVIVAPSVTARLGTQFVDRFLQAGGGAHVDIMNIHLYEPGPIEEIASAVSNIRTIMAANSVGSKPLWDTEGGFGCDPVAQPGCVSAGTVGANELAAPLRNFLVLWAKGVSNMNYYHWEGGSATGALVYGWWENSTPANCGANYNASLVKYNPYCPTPLGATYAQSITWLKSATLTDAYTTQGVNGKIYIFKLLSGGKFRSIIWSTGADEVVRLPKEAAYFSGPTWDKLTYAARLDGTGTKVGIPNALMPGTLTLYRYVTASKTPLLLTSD